jgi:hypothetical protein
MRFKPGDYVVVVNGDKYLYTQTGSIGIVKSADYDTVVVDFLHFTGEQPPEEHGNVYDLESRDVQYATKLAKLLAGVEDESSSQG